MTQDSFLPSTGPRPQGSQHCSLLPWGWQSQQALVQAHRQYPQATSTCTSASLSPSTAPLSSQHPCQHPGLLPTCEAPVCQLLMLRAGVIHQHLCTQPIGTHTSRPQHRFPGCHMSQPGPRPWLPGWGCSQFASIHIGTPQHALEWAEAGAVPRAGTGPRSSDPLS